MKILPSKDMTSYRNYYFAPKWYFIVGTICLCALFIRLGYWQLQRAAEKEHLQATFTTRLQMAPLSLTQLLQKQDKLYYPLTVTGHYDNTHTILLDNKIHAHQVGYEVLTPLLLNNGYILLVNRGWIPTTAHRNVLPVISDILDEQTVVGSIYITPGKSFILGHTAEDKTTWPLRIEALDIPLLANKLHHPVYPFVLLLLPNKMDLPFVRDWQPVAMPAQKHIGYAVQWFTFAIILMIIFIGLNIRKK